MEQKNLYLLLRLSGFFILFLTALFLSFSSNKKAIKSCTLQIEGYFHLENKPKSLIYYAFTQEVLDKSKSVKWFKEQKKIEHIPATASDGSFSINPDIDCPELEDRKIQAESPSIVGLESINKNNSFKKPIMGTLVFYQKQRDSFDYFVYPIDTLISFSKKQYQYEGKISLGNLRFQ